MNVITHPPALLADLVWLKTGKTPTHVRTQALLVIGEFADGTYGVWRIEDLEAIRP